MYGLTAKEKAALFQSKTADKPVPEKPAPRKIGKLNLSALKQDAIEVVKKKTKKAASKKKKVKEAEPAENAAMKERKAKEQDREETEADSASKSTSHDEDDRGGGGGGSHEVEEVTNVKTDGAAAEVRDASPDSTIRKAEADEAAALLALDSDVHPEVSDAIADATVESVPRDVEVKTPDEEEPKPVEETAADAESAEETKEDVEDEGGKAVNGDENLSDAESVDSAKSDESQKSDESKTSSSEKEADKSPNDTGEAKSEGSDEVLEEQAISVEVELSKSEETHGEEDDKQDESEEDEEDKSGEEKEELSFNFTVTTSQDEAAEHQADSIEVDDTPSEEVTIKINREEEEEEEEKEAASDKEGDEEDVSNEDEDGEESSTTPDDAESVIKQSSQSASESDTPSKESVAASSPSEVEEADSGEKPPADVTDAKEADENANDVTAENAEAEKNEQPPAELYQPAPDDFYKNLFYFSGMGSVIGSALSAGVYVPADTARTGLGPEDVENVPKSTYDRRAEIVSTARKQAGEVTDGLQKLQTLLGGMPTFGDSGQQSVSGKDGTAYIQPMAAPSAHNSPAALAIEAELRMAKQVAAPQKMPPPPPLAQVVAQPVAKPMFHPPATPITAVRAPQQRAAPPIAAMNGAGPLLPPWVSQPTLSKPAPQVAVQPIDFKPPAQKVTFSPTTPPDDGLAVPERRRAHSLAVSNDIGKQFVPLAPRENQPRLGGARPYGVHTGIARSQSVPYQERYSGAVVENSRPDPFSPTMIDCSRVKPWQMSRIRRLETKGYRLSSQSENIGKTSLELEDITMTSYSPYLVSTQPKTPSSSPMSADVSKPMYAAAKPMTFINKPRGPSSAYTTPVLGGHAPINSHVFKPRVANHGSPIIRPMSSQTNMHRRSFPYSDL